MGFGCSYGLRFILSELSALCWAGRGAGEGAAGGWVGYGGLGGAQEGLVAEEEALSLQRRYPYAPEWYL